jgi:hypothetical protein
VGPRKEVKFEEIELNIEENRLLSEIEVAVRVVISEEKKFSVILNKSVNDKIKTIAEELEDLIDVPKYGLTFFF